MKITIIGSGCPTCEALYKKVTNLKEAGRIDAEIEYLKDAGELVKRGIMGSPALLIDEKPVYIGMPESDDKLLEIIRQYSK